MYDWGDVYKRQQQSRVAGPTTNRREAFPALSGAYSKAPAANQVAFGATVPLADVGAPGDFYAAVATIPVQPSAPRPGTANALVPAGRPRQTSQALPANLSGQLPIPVFLIKLPPSRPLFSTPTQRHQRSACDTTTVLALVFQSLSALFLLFLLHS